MDFLKNSRCQVNLHLKEELQSFLKKKEHEKISSMGDIHRAEEETLKAFHLRSEEKLHEMHLKAEEKVKNYYHEIEQKINELISKYGHIREKQPQD